MQLAGKTALVTGAAHRLGRAIALALAAEGCDVVVHFHHSADAAAATAAEIAALGVRALPIQADLSRLADIEALGGVIDRDVRGLDLLVNSAAVMLRSDLLQATEADWQRTIDLNLKAAFFVLQMAARCMRRQGGGAIINIADIAGLRPWKRFPIHAISKAGVLMLTQVAALALAPDIRVNAIAPGPVLKPDTMTVARWEEFSRGLPLRRAGTPQDVAQAVIFLAQNDYVTGETLIVDGGNQFI